MRTMWALNAARLLTLSFAFATQSALAFIDPPWVTPSIPRAGEAVSVNVRMGICDATIFLPGYPRITQEGNEIRVIKYGIHSESDDLCVYPVGTLVEPIGAFPAGDYILTVDLLYEDFFGDQQILNIGVIAFTVVGVVPAVPVPTLRPLGLFVLLSLLSGFAVWMLRTRRALILLSAFVAQNAHAFFDPPWITPMSPRAGDTVSVGIRGGICDGIFEREGYPQITREGAAIRLLEYGHHWDTDELCIYGIGTMSEPIGVFPAGNYTLTVDLIYPDFFGDPQILSIGVIPFTVMRAAPAAPVPSFRVSGLIALILGLSSLAVWRLRRRRTSP